VAATPVTINSTKVIAAERLHSQALWRFALVGLGPLMALGVIALSAGLVQRLT